MLGCTDGDSLPVGAGVAAGLLLEPSDGEERLGPGVGLVLPEGVGLGVGLGVLLAVGVGVGLAVWLGVEDGEDDDDGVPAGLSVGQAAALVVLPG